MEKPTEEALELFDAAFPDDERAERRKMFGMPAGFVNGNMFYGVFANGVVLRVGSDRQSEMAEAHDGIGPFEPMGRRWKEYIHVDAELWEAGDELSAWVSEALEFTAKMPAK